MFERYKAMRRQRIANKMMAVQRAFVDLAFRRLRLDHKATPAEIKGAVRLLDTGALDELIDQTAPPTGPLIPERYADVQPFNHEAWKARHGEED